MDASERRKRVAAEAAEWWVTLQGEVSRTQREQYVNWLRESAVNVTEMLRVAQVHGALEQFERWAKLPIDDKGGDAGAVVDLPLPERREWAASTPNPRRPGRLELIGSIAATLLVAAALGALLVLSLRGQVIQTDRGERREVALADGSVVQVDPETRLRVDYETSRRRVVLERGRALFHVAKNPARPFLVQVQDTTVRAVGTAFAVERQPQAVVVTVSEGKVAVFPARSSVPTTKAQSSENPRSGSAAPDVPAPPGLHVSPPPKAEKPVTIVPPSDSGTALDEAVQILLTANEQLTVDSSGTAEPVRQVDSRRVLAWAEGKLIFQNESLTTVVNQFNRYNRIQLHVTDAELARRPVSGVFNAADPESFVAFIQSVVPVKVSRNDAADIIIDAAK